MDSFFPGFLQQDAELDARMYILLFCSCYLILFVRGVMAIN